MKKIQNIVYLCPAINEPMGGIKVIYKHAQILRELGQNAYVYHPGIEKFEISWFNHTSKIRENTNFDPDEDLIIIPEIWAEYFGRICINEKIRFGIFVQGGHLINENVKDVKKLEEIYQNANLIISISDEVTKLISLLEPNNKKIIRVLPYINIRDETNNKEKIITYMPRKLSTHSEKLLFYLQKYLLKDWKIIKINKVDEETVMKILGRASIFLSFSESEGFGLPPLEAGISGCMVIGYDGIGGKEYFEEPNFIRIEHGDISNYLNQVRIGINKIQDGSGFNANFRNGIRKLKNKYSLEQQKEKLIQLSMQISKLR